MSVILEFTDDVDVQQGTLGMAAAFLLMAGELPERESQKCLPTT
jgi:hypothetical protein